MNAAPEKAPEVQWMHYRCATCASAYQTWAGLWRHCADVHGTRPQYAESVVVHHTRRPPVPGGLEASVAALNEAGA